MNEVQQNPFVVGNSVGGTEVFVGREDLIRRVETTLLQPLELGIVLFGQRRAGKTSILQEIEARLRRDPRWVPVFFDLQGRAQASVDVIIRDLAGAIARACGRPEPNFGVGGSEVFRTMWLPEVLASLTPGARIVLLLDEFDVVADPKAPLANHALFEFLRGLCDGDHRGQIAVVYALGRTMEDLDISAGPLFRGLRTEHVSTLGREDFDKLLAKGSTRGNVQWEAEATEHVWALTKGHAMLSQLLASYAWQSALERPSRRVEARNIREIVPRVLQESRSIVGWLWLGLSPACRVVASALAENGSTAVSMDELERLLRQSGVRIMMGQLTEAPARLCDWDLLEETDDRPLRFRFKVELLRQWIEKYQPFSKAREYLDRLNPNAHDDYLRALDRWNSSKTPEDIVAVVRLLDLVLNDTRGNPNHVGATELLAEVYLSQDRLDEAILVVERLLPSQTAALRPRYTQLLLLKAESLKGEGAEAERLEVYERILEVAPGTADAEAEVQAIWRERGKRALAAGQLEAALAAFERGRCEPQIGEVTALFERQRCAEVLERVAKLESTENYDAALEEVSNHLSLIRRVQGHNAETMLVRLAQEQQKMDLFRLACESNDIGRAIDRLRQVVTIDPYYRDAAQRLAALVNRRRGPWVLAWARQGLGGILVALVVVALGEVYRGVMWPPREMGIEERPARGEAEAKSVEPAALPAVEAKAARTGPLATEPLATPVAEEAKAAEVKASGVPSAGAQPAGAQLTGAQPAGAIPRRRGAAKDPMEREAKYLERWFNELCAIAPEWPDDILPLEVEYQVEPSSGAVSGVKLLSSRDGLADRSCVSASEQRIRGFLSFASVPAEKRRASIVVQYQLKRGM